MDKFKFSFGKFFASRKLFVIGFSMSLVTLVAMLTGVLPAIETVYTIFVGGITGLAGLYVTGNLGTKWVQGKQEDGPPEASPKTE